MARLDWAHGKSQAAAFYVEEGMFTGQFCMRELLWSHEKRDVLWTLLDRCINRGQIIHDYMRWYRDTRIKNSLGGVSPLEYRQNLGLIASKILSAPPPIHPDSLTSWVQSFTEANNLPRFTPHSLRHTNATLLIMSGVPVKAVSARLGHADQNVTNAIYSHAISTVDALASDVIGDILSSKKKETSQP